jgi:hypothetical protein
MDVLDTDRKAENAKIFLNGYTEDIEIIENNNTYK